MGRRAPTAIADAYVTLNDIDYPLDILTDSQYAAEPNKTLQASMPTGIYYDPSYPDGRVYRAGARHGADHHAGP